MPAFHADSCLLLPLIRAGLAASLTLLVGCASAPPAPSVESGAGLLDKALQAVGLQTPPPPPMPALPDGLSTLPTLPLRSAVTFRLHAGEVLNTDSAGRSLALVARVYKLRSTDNFLQAPYEAFSGDGGPGKEPSFAKDVVEMREWVLTPGQRVEVVEKQGPEVKALAVVALFRQPAAGRWRYVFDLKGAASTGVTLGAHACALSVALGQPVDTPPEQMRLAGVRCPE